MNASAVSATSRQPLSIVSACPRLGISTISVTPSFRCWRLNDAFAIAQGTVLSFSPEMTSSGPRFGFSVSTCASVHGLRLAVAAWKSGAPDGRHGKGLGEGLGLRFADGVGEAGAGLLGRQRDRPGAVGGGG